MVFCSHCKADCTARLENESFITCDGCGRVICDNIFTDEPTFVKGPGGESRRAGVTVRSIHSGYTESFQRTLDKGVDEMKLIVLSLQLDESIIGPASRFYEIALQRNFTRGRRTVQVAAACLYIACRTSERPKPYLLIDFSETLSINVYVLGSVFLQLCQLLSLEEHNIIKRPVDPTLFVPRFTQKLLDVSNAGVSRTAMHIIASMKRDWMQTGRKPSGICGAALYISALAHGFKFLKSDIVRIVHICEVTLTKRLIEFENTESGSLTIEELENNAKELSNCKLGSKESTRLLCQHKEETPFANGLCKSCFQDFIEISGGLGGTDPPAFQLAEKIRVAKESAKESDEPDADFLFPDKEYPTELGHEIDDNNESFAEAAEENTTNNDRTHTIKFCSSVNGKTDGTSDTCGKFKDSSDVNGDESDGLSDIDDIEVNGYLNNEEETRYKKIIWEEMNREYLEEQAAKMEAGQDLTKSKPKKDRHQKQDPNAAPAQTAAEAARQMLSKKRFSSKINYDALEKCLSEDVAAPSKKAKASTEDGDENGGEIGTDKHLKSDGVVKENELGEEDEEGMDGYEFDNETAEQEWQFDEDGYEYGFDEHEF